MKPLQGSLFEEDYLVRTLGALVNNPAIALTELVANGWDAGASRVDISLPDRLDGELVVRDDGSGMTPEQFKQRWMMLGYNRVRHQGSEAEFPAERAGWRRPAYGRNGIGRHALLCFARSYAVETRRESRGGRFIVSTASGQNPFVLISEETFEAEGHGTELHATVTRNLPTADRMRDVLAARFLHDPRFQLFVNGRGVPLEDHSSLIERMLLRITDTVNAEVFFVDSTIAARTTHYQGVAFWVGGRLVGEPSWVLGDRALIDGRTKIAKRYTAVVKTDALLDDVLPDWSGFKRTPNVDSLYAVVGDYIETVLRRLSAQRMTETRDGVLENYREELQTLQPLAVAEVKEFVEQMAVLQPMASQETLSVGVRAYINLEKSRSGQALLEKLAHLSEDDVEGLNRLLSEWTVRDALGVLDEIGRRITTIEAIKVLSRSAGVDELHVLHPLVTQARWLFGPEFDSPEYASNMSIQNAVAEVFKERLLAGAFENPRRRPDLLVLNDATLSAVGIEEIIGGLSETRTLLLIELKCGDSTIGRNEMSQADGYVQDLMTCGHLPGLAMIRAFVVGHKLSENLVPRRAVGEGERFVIHAVPYSYLVQTGERRLFRLREKLNQHYGSMSAQELIQRTTEPGAEGEQLTFNDARLDTRQH